MRNYFKTPLKIEIIFLLLITWPILDAILVPLLRVCTSVDLNSLETVFCLPITHNGLIYYGRIIGYVLITYVVSLIIGPLINKYLWRKTKKVELQNFREGLSLEALIILVFRESILVIFIYFILLLFTFGTLDDPIKKIFDNIYNQSHNESELVVPYAHANGWQKIDEKMTFAIGGIDSGRGGSSHELSYKTDFTSIEAKNKLLTFFANEGYTINQNKTSYDPPGLLFSGIIKLKQETCAVEVQAREEQINPNRSIIDLGFSCDINP